MSLKTVGIKSRVVHTFKAKIVWLLQGETTCISQQPM